MPLTALDDAAWASPWRDAPVAGKAALSLALLTTALIAPAWPGCGLVAAASVLLICGPARIPARVLATAMAAPLGFILVGAISVAVVVGQSTPDAWWALGPLFLDAPSAARALGAFGHGLAGTLAIMLLATTTPMVDLLSGLRRLGLPAPLVEVAELVYRLLFVLLATLLANLAAQRARLGHGRKVPLRRRLATAADTLGSLLVRSWHRAARLQAGLESRGYTGDLRTLPHQAGRTTLAPWLVGTLLAVWAGIIAAWLGGTR